jgi:hypothetical protein
VKKGLFCVPLAVLLTCVSCSQRNGLYPVYGKVTYMGEPAAGAFVHFLRAGADPINDPAVMGVVKDDGSFTLVSGDLGQGAIPGDYAVLIEWRHGSRHGKAGANTPSPPDRLGGRYADPAHPLLHATVKPATNHLAAMELTD